MTPIADIRNDFYLGPDGPVETYRFAGLSPEDLAMVMAFDFPALRDSSVELRPASVVVHCACGEATEQASGGWPETEVDCVCGRCWYVKLVAEPSEHTGADLELIG